MAGELLGTALAEFMAGCFRCEFGEAIASTLDFVQHDVVEDSTLPKLTWLTGGAREHIRDLYSRTMTKSMRCVPCL